MKSNCKSLQGGGEIRLIGAKSGFVDFRRMDCRICCHFCRARVSEIRILLLLLLLLLLLGMLCIIVHV